MRADSQEIRNPHDRALVATIQALDTALEAGRSALLHYGASHEIAPDRPRAETLMLLRHLQTQARALVAIAAALGFEDERLPADPSPQ